MQPTRGSGARLEGRRRGDHGRAKVLDSSGNEVTLFRSKLANGRWGFVMVPTDSGANSCVSGAAVKVTATDEIKFDPDAKSSAAPQKPAGRS